MVSRGQSQNDDKMATLSKAVQKLEQKTSGNDAQIRAAGKGVHDAIRENA